MSSSIAVRQFVALARGEMAVRKVNNPFRVVMVVEQKRYCTRCCGARTFDVIFKRGVLFMEIEIEMAAICRACGKVVGEQTLRVHWVGPSTTPFDDAQGSAQDGGK